MLLDRRRLVQSLSLRATRSNPEFPGLPRRFAPRNDDVVDPLFILRLDPGLRRDDNTVENVYFDRVLFVSFGRTEDGADNSFQSNVE